MIDIRALADAGVFDPPPSTIAVPWSYLATTAAAVAAVAAALIAAALLAARASTRPVNRDRRRGDGRTR